jgi:hypothetical protein
MSSIREVLDTEINGEEPIRSVDIDTLFEEARISIKEATKDLQEKSQKVELIHQLAQSVILENYHLEKKIADLENKLKMVVSDHPLYDFIEGEIFMSSHLMFRGRCGEMINEEINKALAEQARQNDRYGFTNEDIRNFIQHIKSDFR